LEARNILVPDLLFVVSVVNSDGVVIASTHPGEIALNPVQGDLSGLRSSDALWVDKPRAGQTPGNWTLRFAADLARPTVRSAAPF
jgi:hypothetical protein